METRNTALISLETLKGKPFPHRFQHTLMIAIRKLNTMEGVTKSLRHPVKVLCLCTLTPPERFTLSMSSVCLRL